jgi:hypothetical protein
LTGIHAESPLAVVFENCDLSGFLPIAAGVATHEHGCLLTSNVDESEEDQAQMLREAEASFPPQFADELEIAPCEPSRSLVSRWSLSSPAGGAACR